jgi:ABC-type antimicrobial peptide transport system permease subunit
VVVDDGRGGTVRLRLVGLLATSVFQSELLVSEAAFTAAFPDRTGDSVFLVDTEEGSDTERIVELLERTLAPYGFDAAPAGERIARFAEVERTYLSTFQLLGGFGLLLGTVGLAVVLVRNLLERRGELAAMRAFGFRRSRIGWLVAGETAFLLAVGLGIGALSAAGAVAPRLLTARTPWTSVAVTLVTVGGIGMLAAVAALVPALRTPLLPALKSER